MTEKSPLKSPKKSKLSRSVLEERYKKAEEAKRILLVLIEKFNLPPPVIVHALYVTSGIVDDAIKYLEDPTFGPVWSMPEDVEILTSGNLDDIEKRHGFKKLQERKEFLAQIVDEPLFKAPQVSGKLKWKCATV